MLFFFTKSEEMSRVGSRDRHPRWRSKNDGHCFFVMGYGMLGDGLTNLINECVGAALF